jgi:hypothetical protein
VDKVGRTGYCIFARLKSYPVNDFHSLAFHERDVDSYERINHPQPQEIAEKSVSMEFPTT